MEQAESVLLELSEKDSSDDTSGGTATKGEILQIEHLQVASQGSNSSVSGSGSSTNSSNTTTSFGMGSGGTMAGRGGEMLKAATEEIIEKLRAELQQERAARQKAEKMVLSLTNNV